MSSLPIAARLRIGFVLPRLTERTVGGAEVHGKWLAQRLAAQGHAVEVLTTCATSHFTWANELPPGQDRVEGLAVRRFPVDERDTRLHAQLEGAIHAGAALSREEELLWSRNGVVSSAMEEELLRHGHGFDLLVALPYLFGTTYASHAVRPERTVLIPCLHDEPYARLRIVGEMLRGARGLMLNSAPEAALAARLHGALAPHEIVGVGFDPPRLGDAAAVRRRYGLPERFVLYMGRIEEAKNVPLLVDHFLRYKERRRTDLALVLGGSGHVETGGHPSVRTCGFVAQADLDTVFEAGTVLCQPSLMESLSMVMMQAWLTGRPVLVHGHCAVTRHHCEEANGGLWFTSYPEFEEALDRMERSPELRSALGAAGRRYVRQRYSWQAVLERFHGAAERFLGGAALGRDAAAPVLTRG